MQGAFILKGFRRGGTRRLTPARPLPPPRFESQKRDSSGIYLVTVLGTIQDLSQSRLIALESSQSPCQFKGLSLLVLLNHSLGQSSKFALNRRGTQKMPSVVASKTHTQVSSE